LLQCFTGEGAADELLHLKNCLACASRYKQLETEMGLITRALQTPPPSHRQSARGLVPWRVAISAVAVLAAFIIGWSLRGVALTPSGSAPIAMHQPAGSGAPIQLASKAGGPPPAMYAAYVQDVFSGDPCSDANDPLTPGCL
jgi:hypothetical protein